MTANDYKFLTVIIPTYNRCDQIIENLELTVPQILAYQDRVRIYISDNASTDGTKERVKPWLEKYPENIAYFCQEKNITASPNFNHAVHSINSDYIFVLGDDDVLFPNFIQTALTLIEKNPEIGLFHFNYLMGLNNLNDCRLLHVDINPNNMLKKYNNGESFILEHFNGPSFISSNLFKRSLWIDGTKSIKDDCPGYVWFSILLYGCLKHPCAYYSVPVLIQRIPQNNPYSKNWPLYYVVGLGNLFKHLDAECPRMYDSWIRESQYEHLRKMLLVLSESCFFRKFYKENRKKMAAHFKRNVVKIYFSLCLLPIPKFFMGKMIPYFVKSLKLLGMK